MDQELGMREKWTQEYSSKGIPSSFRTEPSDSATWFRSQLPEAVHSIVDLGCGRGRNARYLAEEGFSVDAIDWVKHDIPTHSNLTQHTGDLTKSFPFEDAAFDAAIDIFCFKHVTNDHEHYLREVHRILKPSGLYMLNLATTEDGFYGPLLEHSPDPARNLVRDPVAEVDSILFTPETLTAALTPFFTIQTLEECRSTSPMHGKVYERVMLRAICTARP